MRLTQLRRDAGVGEEQDVASAAARVAATDATIPLLEFETKRAEYRISVLTGVRPGELSADLSPRVYAPIDKSLPIGNPAELLRRRPDVRAAERRLSAATERQGVAVAQLFPEVSVSAFVGFLAGRGSLFFTGSSFASTASPGVSWSAFDLGRARARVRASGAVTDQALASYEDTVLNALEETENSFANYHAQQERLLRLNLQAQESKRAADIARFRYKEGVTDFLTFSMPSAPNSRPKTPSPKVKKTSTSRSSPSIKPWVAFWSRPRASFSINNSNDRDVAKTITCSDTEGWFAL